MSDEEIISQRNLANEQEKPVGLFAGLFQGIIDTFREHEQHLRELVIAQREKKLEISENQQLSIEPEASRSWVLGLLEEWLFKKELMASIKPEAPAQTKELVHIGLGAKDAYIDKPDALAQNQGPSLGDLGNLPSPHTPMNIVGRSQSQNVGHLLAA